MLVISLDETNERRVVQAGNMKQLTIKEKHGNGQLTTRTLQKCWGYVRFTRARVTFNAMPGSLTIYVFAAPWHQRLINPARFVRIYFNNLIPRCQFFQFVLTELVDFFLWQRNIDKACKNINIKEIIGTFSSLCDVPIRHVKLKQKRLQHSLKTLACQRAATAGLYTLNKMWRRKRSQGTFN